MLRQPAPPPKPVEPPMVVAKPIERPIVKEPPPPVVPCSSPKVVPKDKNTEFAVVSEVIAVPVNENVVPPML